MVVSLFAWLSGRRLGGRPAAPIAAFVLLAFATTGLHTAGSRWALVGAAASAAVTLLVVAALLPWERLPAPALLLMPLGCDAVLAALRHAQGGSASGYGPLAILPIIWAGLALGRRAVFVMAAATAALFGLPIALAGAPLYPASGWRGVVLWPAVALIVGLVVNAVVAEQRRQAALSIEHAGELEATQQALDVVAAVARDVAAAKPEPARQMICDAAVVAGSALLATIVEPTGDGSFAITGSSGIPIPQDELRAGVRPQASLRAFYSREPVLIRDVSEDANVSPLIAQATGLKSILYQPILRQDKPVGILAVGWGTLQGELSPRATAVYASLAAEAGAAIERADLLWRLDRLARTDELTGLPNRRAWNDVVATALAEQSKPFSIALLDLDHFKRYNDNRGHIAGDDLLAAAAAAWSANLRKGDVLARYGGEEFALLLPDCLARDAEPIIRRLCQATPGGVTCSAGIAESGASDRDALMHEADKALYTAKNTGRNRVIAA